MRRLITAYSLLVIAGLFGCGERDPKTTAELRGRMANEEAERDKARLKRLKGTKVFLQSRYNNLIVHARKDCPSVLLPGKGDHASDFELNEVEVREERFVDSKGFFYDATLCPRCIE
ncbi:MAG: hypothetical protein AAB074_02195 [Planctomycetota bacterium]